MIEDITKNNFTLWIKWVWDTYQVKKKFPSAKIGFMAKLKGKSYLGQFSRIDNKVLLENTSVGDFSYIGTEVRLNYTSIGKFCSIGPGVYAGLGVHPTSTFVSTSNHLYSGDPLQTEAPFFEDYRETTIGNDVWIGARAIIIDGVQIGDGAVVGAGAVVTKDVPPYAIVGGVPAKIIKYRFEPDQISFLNQFRWWDRDSDWIMKNKTLLSDIKVLMKENLAQSNEKVLK